AGVIIYPGGGYAGVTIDKEGYDVARRLADTGITGIVLKYSLPRPDITWGGLPWPFEDLARAQQIVRERAREWDIDPARLGVMGFSAGGPLAAGAASEEGSTLAFAAVIYPVITMERRLTHAGSRFRLLGRHPDPELVRRYSFEHRVSRRH